MPVNVAGVERRVFADDKVKLRPPGSKTSMQIDRDTTRALVKGAGRRCWGSCLNKPGKLKAVGKTPEAQRKEGLVRLSCPANHVDAFVGSVASRAVRKGSPVILRHPVRDASQ